MGRLVIFRCFVSAAASGRVLFAGSCLCRASSQWEARCHLRARLRARFGQCVVFVRFV